MQYVSFKKKSLQAQYSVSDMIGAKRNCPFSNCIIRGTIVNQSMLIIGIRI